MGESIYLVKDAGQDSSLGERRLLTAREVAAYLRIPPKKVYELAIPKVAISPRRLRWLESDVRAYTTRCRVA